MRIIDKNTDYYDYLQNVYRDDSIVFDRTDSFLLTKDFMCRYLWMQTCYLSDTDHVFVLLQACHTFWLFLFTVTDRNDYNCPEDYTVDLLEHWTNYNTPRVLLQISVITFDWNLAAQIKGSYDHRLRRRPYDVSQIKRKAHILRSAVDQSNIAVVHTIDECRVAVGGGAYRTKHIPLLKASGMAQHIEPFDLYLALEQYWNLEKQSQERTSSIGYTDAEKIEAHGFDRKTSFRGNL